MGNDEHSTNVEREAREPRARSPRVLPHDVGRVPGRRGRRSISRTTISSTRRKSGTCAPCATLFETNPRERLHLSKESTKGSTASRARSSSSRRISWTGSARSTSCRPSTSARRTTSSPSRGSSSRSSSSSRRIPSSCGRRSASTRSSTSSRAGSRTSRSRASARRGGSRSRSTRRT